MVMDKIGRSWPGLLLVMSISFPAMWIGNQFPLIGGPVSAICLGIAIRNCIGVSESAAPGVRFCASTMLQAGIVALGAGLSLDQVWRTGTDSYALMLFTFATVLLVSFYLGRWMRIPSRLNVLISVGTAICGGSAIAAVSPIVKARDTEIAYAIAIIFICNIAAVFLFPVVGHWLNLSNEAFGLWAGTAINDTSSVVAAGYAYSSEAGDYSVIVKLARSMLILPVSVALAVLIGMRPGKYGEKSTFFNLKLKNIFPWFIIGFLLFSGLHTIGLFSAEVIHVSQLIGKGLITMALAAVGLNADFKAMFRIGLKPVWFGLSVWLAIAISGLAVLFTEGKL